jgi:hypothetical protein
VLVLLLPQPQHLLLVLLLPLPRQQVLLVLVLLLHRRLLPLLQQARRRLSTRPPSPVLCLRPYGLAPPWLRPLHLLLLHLRLLWAWVAAAAKKQETTHASQVSCQHNRSFRSCQQQRPHNHSHSESTNVRASTTFKAQLPPH